MSKPFFTSGHIQEAMRINPEFATKVEFIFNDYPTIQARIERLEKALGSLVEMDRRDNLTDPDMMIPDDERDRLFKEAKDVLEEGK